MATLNSFLPLSPSHIVFTSSPYAPTSATTNTSNLSGEFLTDGRFLEGHAGESKSFQSVQLMPPPPSCYQYSTSSVASQSLNTASSNQSGFANQSAMDACNDLNEQFPPLTPLSSSTSGSFSPLSPSQSHSSNSTSPVQLSSPSTSNNSLSPIPPLTPIIDSKSSSTLSSSCSSSSVPPVRRRAEQRQYDSLRRRNIRVQFEDLRKTLQEAQALTKTRALSELLPMSDLAQRSKFAKKSRNALENCSTIDLLYAAQHTITRLQEMKDEMEKQLTESINECSNSEESDERPTSMQTVVKLENSCGKSNHKENDIDSAKWLSAIEDSKLALTARKRKRSDVIDAKSFDEIRTLLHSISVVNRRYQLQVSAVRAMENQIPKFLVTDSELYLKNIGVMGLDGRLVSVSNPYCSCLDDPTPYIAFFKQNYTKFRSPHLVMMHAFCYLLANGFQYLEGWRSDEQAITAEVGEIPPERLYQLFADSRSLSLDETSSSSSTVAQSSHPLATYALPGRSFQILMDTLRLFVRLGKEQYDRTMQQLTPFAVKAVPKELANSILLPERAAPNIPKDFIFDENIKLEYEDICGFYELYSGKKDMVSFNKRKVDLLGSSYRCVDVDLCLIRDTAGTPVAHMSIHRRSYVCAS